MSQEQGDHKHSDQGQVFGVDEGFSVQSRMQQEQQHSEQRDGRTAEQPACQQIAEESTRYEEQVGQEVAAKQDGAGVVLQSQDALDNQERQLECRAVKLKVISPRVISQKLVVLAENVADRLQSQFRADETRPTIRRSRRGQRLPLR